MGEKPFGVNRAANQAIFACIAEHPAVFAHCSSEFPLSGRAAHRTDDGDRRRSGEIIEVNAGFLHSSDLDPRKPLNWKRMIQFDGEYRLHG